jgi:hypothetical protein
VFWSGGGMKQEVRSSSTPVYVLTLSSSFICMAYLRQCLNIRHKWHLCLRESEKVKTSRDSRTLNHFIRATFIYSNPSNSTKSGIRLMPCFRRLKAAQYSESMFWKKGFFMFSHLWRRIVLIKPSLVLRTEISSRMCFSHEKRF